MKNRFLGVCCSIAALAFLAGACAANPEDGPVDLEAPELISVQVSPSEVTPGQPMTITATVSDNVGVADVAFLVGRNGTPSGFCSGSAQLVSGTAMLGTWQISCVAPTALNAGEYQAGTVALDARLNAVSTTDESPLDVRGLFTVLGDLNDIEAPVVQSVTTSPSTAAPGAQIKISAHVTDATGTANVGFVVRRDGIDTMDWCAEGATLTSGTVTDGTWELTCQVGSSAASGAYRVNTAAADVLNNFGGIGDDGADAVAGPFDVSPPAA